MSFRSKLYANIVKKSPLSSQIEKNASANNHDSAEQLFQEPIRNRLIAFRASPYCI